VTSGLFWRYIGIDAGRGGEEEPFGRVDPGCLQHVDVDHGAVAGDVGVESGYVADAAHVRRQVVHLVDLPGGDQAVVEAAEVQEISNSWLGLGSYSGCLMSTPRTQ
jgi:hypothetical protein